MDVTDICIPLYWYSKKGSSNSIADVVYGDNASLIAFAYIAMLGNEESVWKNIRAKIAARVEKQVSSPCGVTYLGQPLPPIRGVLCYSNCRYGKIVDRIR
jgi:hypothetical protein